MPLMKLPSSSSERRSLGQVGHCHHIDALGRWSAVVAWQRWGKIILNRQ